MTHQKQSGGSGSTNVQVASINVGLGYEDVRSIARDIFEQNFANLAKQAGEIAGARAEEIRDEIIDRLSKSDVDPDNFSHVEKQIALMDAQKAYALSGDEELRQVLVDAVIGIAPEKERSLKSIVLQESIKVVPSLTAPQLRILATVFIIRHVNLASPDSLKALFEQYLRYAELSLGDLDVTAGYLRHLEYLGCGKTSISSVALYGLMQASYPGLISQGYERDELFAAFQPDAFPSGGVMPCFRNPELMQIAAKDSNVLDLKSGSWSAHQKNIAAEKLSSNLID